MIATKHNRLTAAQAAAERAKLLAQHRSLMKRELALRDAYGPLILRWAREASGLTAFFVHRGDVADPAYLQLDGLVGENRWATDKGRWSNGIDIIVETSNPHLHLVRCFTPGKPTRLTNEQAQRARERRGGIAGYPAFPWETPEEAERHWLDHRRLRDTDPRTRRTSRL